MSMLLHWFLSREWLFLGVQVRDVVVVVSRWFGGVLMGPQRFTVINNTARMLLEECGLDNRDSKPAGRSGKKK